MVIVISEHLCDLEIFNKKLQKTFDDQNRLGQPIRHIQLREQFRKEAILLTVELRTEE